jgi:GNAT superfamily N-acetyltransferase
MNAISPCFGAYPAGQQVAIGRVIAGSSTVAYVADVFVFPSCRGQGVARRLVHAIVSRPKLKGVRILLQTRDARGLYQKFGFEQPEESNTLMVCRNSP